MSFGSSGFAWIHSGAPSDPRVHWGYRGFTKALISQFALVHSGVTRRLRVHSGSRGFTTARLGVDWYFRVLVVSLQHA